MRAARKNQDLKHAAVEINKQAMYVIQIIWRRIGRCMPATALQAADQHVLTTLRHRAIKLQAMLLALVVPSSTKKFLKRRDHGFDQYHQSLFTLTTDDGDG